MPVARDAQPRSQPERAPAGRPCQCSALAERARRSDGPARGQRELPWPEHDSRRRAGRAPGAARSRPAPDQAGARRLSAARERAGRAARRAAEAQLKALGQLAPGSAPRPSGKLNVKDDEPSKSCLRAAAKRTEAAEVR